MSLMQFIAKNFWHVFPILLCGAAAILIIVERSAALGWAYPMENMDGFFERIRNMILRNSIQEAIAFCERFRTKPVARVVREGLIRAHQPEHLIENGLQIAVGEASEKIQVRTPFLATLANVSTLFGLLGTIIGLVESFQAVGQAVAQQRAALLANGISTAMNSTMMGLAVAIPSMIAYSILMARTNKVTGQIEQSAVRTMDILQQSYFNAKSGDVPPNEPNHRRKSK